MRHDSQGLVEIQQAKELEETKLGKDRHYEISRTGFRVRLQQNSSLGSQGVLEMAKSPELPS
jgi:hypothetical protein